VDSARLRDLLEDVRRGALDVDEGMRRLKGLYVQVGPVAFLNLHCPVLNRLRTRHTQEPAF